MKDLPQTYFEHLERADKALRRAVGSVIGLGCPALSYFPNSDCCEELLTCAHIAAGQVRGHLSNSFESFINSSINTINSHLKGKNTVAAKELQTRQNTLIEQNHQVVTDVAALALPALQINTLAEIEKVLANQGWKHPEEFFKNTFDGHANEKHNPHQISNIAHAGLEEASREIKAAMQIYEQVPVSSKRQSFVGGKT